MSIIDDFNASLPFDGSISVSGSKMVVTNYRVEQTGSADSGESYVYTSVNGTFNDAVLAHTFVNPGASPANDKFGMICSMNANYIAIGSVDGVYVYNASTYSLLYTIPFTDGLQSNRQSSIAVDGTRLVVGETYSNATPPYYFGYAKVYDLTTGLLETTLNNPDAYPGSVGNDLFGKSVAIDGDLVAVGAPGEFDDISQGNNGVVYVFDLLGNPTKTFSNASKDGHGVAVALSGNYVATLYEEGMVIYDITTELEVADSGYIPFDALSTSDAIQRYSLSMDGNQIALQVDTYSATNDSTADQYSYAFSTVLGDWSDMATVLAYTEQRATSGSYTNENYNDSFNNVCVDSGIVYTIRKGDHKSARVATYNFSNDWSYTLFDIQPNYYYTTFTQGIASALNNFDGFVADMTYSLVGGPYPEITSFITTGGPIEGGFTYQPADCHEGDYTFQYRLTHDVTGFQSAVMTGVISDFEPKPVITPGVYTSTLSANVTGNLVDDDTCAITSYTYVLVGTPSQPLDYFNSDGTFSYTPAPCYVGTVTFQYKVVTPLGNETEDITVTINVSEPAPTAVNDSYTTLEWATKTGDVSTNDTCVLPEYTYALVGTPPVELDFFNADGTFSLTPTAPFIGDYTFQYNITTSPSGYVSNTATVTVTSATDLLAVDDSFNSNDWEVVTGNVGTNDIAVGVGDTFSIVGTPPAELDFFNADGSFSFSHVFPFSGIKTFQYKITKPNTYESNVGTVSVISLATPVVAVNDTFTSTNSATVIGNVGTNDTYQPADTFVLVSDPSGNIDYFNADGSFSFSPVFPFLGDYQFTYKIIDALDASESVATVTITCVRSAIVIVDDVLDISYNWATVTGNVATNDTFISGVDTFEIVSDPDGIVQVFDGTGYIEAIPNFPFVGSHTAQYKIRDGYTGLLTTETGNIQLDSVFNYDLSDYPSLLTQASGSHYDLYVKFPFLRNVSDSLSALNTRLTSDGDYLEQDSGLSIGNRLGSGSLDAADATTKIIDWLDRYMDYNNDFIPRSILEVVDLTYWNAIPSMKPAEITLSAPSLDPVYPYYASYTMTDPEFWSMGISEIYGVNVTILLEPAYTNTSDVSWYAPDPTVSRSGWFSQGITEWARTTEVTDYYINNGSYTGYVYPIHQTCNNSASVMSCNESTYFMDPLDGCLYSYYGLSSPKLPGYLFSDEYFHYRLSPTGTYHDYEEPRVGSATYVKSDGIVTSDHFITAPTDAVFTGSNITLPLDTNELLIEPSTVTITSEAPSTRHTSRSMKTNVVTSSAHRYMYEFVYAPMDVNDAADLISLVTAKSGKQDFFYMAIPNVAALGVNTLYKEVGNTDNTVNVFESVHPTTGETSGGKGDDTVVLFDCPVSYFPAGLLMRFSNHDKLYKTVSDSTRTVDGAVKLKFEPPLRQSVEAQQLVLREAYDNYDGTHNLVRVRLADDFVEYNVNASGLTVVKIKFIEDTN